VTWLVALVAAALAAVLHFLWPYVARCGGAYSTSSAEAAEWAFRRIGVAGKRVYDLGCGYGRVLLIARRLGAVPVGVELDPLRWLICRIRCRCRVIYGDMFKISALRRRRGLRLPVAVGKRQASRKVQKGAEAWHVRRLVHVGGAGL
jgi:SAM-dependent methyltransferase